MVAYLNFEKPLILCMNFTDFLHIFGELSYFPPLKSAMCEFRLLIGTAESVLIKRFLNLRANQNWLLCSKSHLLEFAAYYVNLLLDSWDGWDFMNKREPQLLGYGSPLA